MKALIIAAGNGTRMQPVTRGRHKSLMSLLGLKIIERVILGAKAAGISEFVIVHGYRGEDIKGVIGDGEKYGVSVDYLENGDWEKANGISVLRAKKYFRENFVLLMSDHVFDPKTLVRIQRLKLKDKECALAVDKNLESVLDVKDTTKVILKAGRVVDIGKNLNSYNVYDTGMFVCTPYLFQVLEKTTSRGKNSLTNGMAVLAEEGGLRAFDIKGRFWADCDTFADIKFTEKKLLASLVKGKDGWVSKKFNRKISTFITRFLVKTSVTPNMMSFFIPILGLLTFFILAKGTYPWFLIGGLLVQFLSIVDGCDGEIARLKFRQSLWGKWLDPILDRYVDTAIIAGMAYGYWNTTGNNFILPIASFVVLADILQDYMSSKFFVETGKKLKLSDLAFKRDARLLILAVGAITNQILAAFLIFILFSQYKVIGRLIAGKQIADELEVGIIKRRKRENIVATHVKRVDSPVEQKDKVGAISLKGQIFESAATRNS